MHNLKNYDKQFQDEWQQFFTEAIARGDFNDSSESRAAFDSLVSTYAEARRMIQAHGLDMGMKVFSSSALTVLSQFEKAGESEDFQLGAATALRLILEATSISFHETYADLILDDCSPKTDAEIKA